MTFPQEKCDVQQRLETALETGLVPDDAQRRAAQILARLNTPVQVVVIGGPGSGKSTLINMLLGEPVLASRASLPPVEIAFGARERTICLQSCGGEQVREGIDLTAPVPPETAIIRVELPRDSLRHLTLTELDLRGGHHEQRAIADWAENRADIVLWCSQSFDEKEQSLWASAPDTLKDHSFLVISKADNLERRGVLSSRISQLSDIVSEEFYRMYPVATLQAISAISGDGTRNENIWVASGGHALASAVRQLVDTGRRADRDNALAFLARYTPDLPDVVRPKAQPDADPAKGWVETLPTTDRAELARQTGATGTFRQALAFLQERADLMLGVVGANRPDTQALVLDHCLETAEKLSEIVMAVEDDDPTLCEIQEDILECGDMMVLFHLEKTEDAATDAVTLLLQLKKEMSLAVAA